MLYRSTVFLLILKNVSVIERGMFISIMIMDLSSPYSYINFCFLHFEVMLLGAYKFRIVIVAL